MHTTENPPAPRTNHRRRLPRGDPERTFLPTFSPGCGRPVARSQGSTSLPCVPGRTPRRRSPAAPSRFFLRPELGFRSFVPATDHRCATSQRIGGSRKMMPEAPEHFQGGSPSGAKCHVDRRLRPAAEGAVAGRSIAGLAPFRGTAPSPLPQRKVRCGVAGYFRRP